MAIVDGKIRCASCGEDKPLAAYSPSVAGRGNGKCKPCNAALQRAWVAKNPRAARAIFERATTSGSRKNTALMYRYGITSEEYARMVEAQCGACAICNQPPVGKAKLCVDHDHQTGAVRGLLCMKCNIALGRLGDSIEGLRRALAYLRKHESTSRRLPVRINLMEVQHVGSA